VCLVSYEFPPFAGGEGVYTRDLMMALQSRGSEVLLITPDWSRSRTEDNQSIVHVNPLQIPGLKTSSFMLRANRKLKQLSRDIDIVHYTNDYCGFGASRSQIGRPVLATIHHTHSYEASSVSPYLDRGTIGRLKFSFSEKILSWMEKNTLRNADSVIAVSQFTSGNALSLYPFLRDRIKVVLNAVDETKFNPNQDPISFRKKLVLQSNPVVLFVGRLTAIKGLKFLIESFKEVVLNVPDVKLVLVGSGTDEVEAEIRSQISKLGLQSSVILAGRISDDDLPGAYAASDLVVLPSLAEGFGLVLLEAMATCKPVVTTKLGPTEEIVTHGKEGLLIPKADSHCLAEAIISILSDKSLATRMGQSGRRKIEAKFTISRWASQMIDVYQELLS